MISIGNSLELTNYSSELSKNCGIISRIWARDVHLFLKISNIKRIHNQEQSKEEIVYKE